MVHGPEESAESLAFASEPLIGSLVNILSANSADSYDGGGSNRHGSFDLGNQDSNRKQPLPNLGSMLQVDYNFIDVEYRYGFSQVCEYYYYVRLGWVRDSYNGGGSNRRGSFDLGNQDSNRKQPFPNSIDIKVSQIQLVQSWKLRPFYVI